MHEVAVKLKTRLQLCKKVFPCILLLGAHPRAIFCLLMNPAERLERNEAAGVWPVL